MNTTGIRRSPRQQLELIRDHLLAGNKDKVKAAIEGKCSMQTIKSFVNDIEGALEKTTVKNGTIQRVVDELPEVGLDEAITSYNFFLNQMNEEIDGQRAISKLNGRYKIISNINEEVLKFVTLKIRSLSEEPYLPAFFCRVALPNIKGTKVCDGFIINSNNRLIFSGLSEYVSIFMVVNRPIDKDEDCVRGVIIIEDRAERRTHISSVVLGGSTIPIEQMQQKLEDTHFEV